MRLENTIDQRSKLSMNNDKKSIYLDYNATTPVDPLVFAAMEPYFKDYFGNPASAGHTWGWKAASATEKARLQVAQLINAGLNEIFFTSGATEANNWAIFGLISKIRNENPDEKIHIISSCLEHNSIMKSLEAAQRLNVEIDFLAVNKFGQIDIESVRHAIKPHTKLISLIWVNNEIGSINPIGEIAKITKAQKIYLHTDATQAVGKLPVNVMELGIDMMSFSGHKIYGPKGIGVLYIRSKDPKVQIEPLIHGGGHERGLRSGTLNVPGIVGLGVAAEICEKNLVEEAARLTNLRHLMWEKLKKAIPEVSLNGHPTERSCNNLSITLPINTEAILPHLQKLGVSTGSACSTGSIAISHVLKGIGLGPIEAQRTLRLSLGRWTTEEEVLEAVETLKSAILMKNT